MQPSIIIPVLNEAPNLPSLSTQLAPLVQAGAEVLFVDGGSTDGTPNLAGSAGFRTIRSARGRARQMNAGAKAARGDLLIFLHADTVLPGEALAAIADALRRGHAWGRFDVRIAGRPWMLRVVAQMMNRRSRLTGIATGDQAMFMIRETFELVGGFPDQPLMEDIEMSRRLRAHSRPACLRLKVTTSGRRWESRGVWRTILLMWRLRWDYWRGVPANTLAEAYR
ncbi:TIGR04283 family arsenosugar biosynthesis glycosyltransferase [Aromatoleum toluclasticum]|uniref:TIGR04283 family arsenosugar biosynthesis glycosyltransferase n=1 Tax=Aromatoleum toluclasticum TaxID=92003 RepID=UPI001D194B2C|nr:TIGR04283 family arsenosugar biosynthesis glycosyltransferase [Aromatoleum toluclasticum]MCC4118175.1 TIGR04283 family arsenosugar biosynthesis glycosyltransferase [Aromatoleum toluclasticum]